MTRNTRHPVPVLRHIWIALILSAICTVGALAQQEAALPSKEASRKLLREATGAAATPATELLKSLEGPDSPTFEQAVALVQLGRPDLLLPLLKTEPLDVKATIADALMRASGKAVASALLDELLALEFHRYEDYPRQFPLLFAGVPSRSQSERTRYSIERALLTVTDTFAEIDPTWHIAQKKALIERAIEKLPAEPASTLSSANAPAQPQTTIENRHSILPAATEFVRLNRADLLLPMLKVASLADRKSLAQALAAAKGRPVAEALLTQWNELHLPLGWEDTQISAVKEEALNATEKALATVTGTDCDPGWTREQKQVAFQTSIDKMPARPEPR
ncbi:hypothetical protein DB346_10730 [Verrucomicrobia bacterium LW23]|nr:hypothetical protein DB346_10730 [Verrucomicrobia bacterium LW23]